MINVGSRVEFPINPSFVPVGEQSDIGERKPKRHYSDPGGLTEDDWKTIGMIAEGFGADIARRERQRRRGRRDGISNIIDIRVAAKPRRTPI